MNSKNFKLSKNVKFVQSGGGYETVAYIFGLFIVMFIGIVIYYTTVGYTISFGWDKLFFILDKKQPVDVDMTIDNKPEVSVELEPQAPPILPPPILPISPEIKPDGHEIDSLFGGALFGESDINGSKKSSGSVFNISRNLYTYSDAEPLCKAMGAELASYNQLLEAYKNGADWCNYGWVKGQMAVYPTQEKTWEKLQKGPSDYRFSCGRPGLNGGYFDNPELTFGVNCFGKRPAQNDSDDLENSAEFTSPPTAEQIEFDKKVQKFRDELGNVTVLPFNKGQWSD